MKKMQWERPLCAGAFLLLSTTMYAGIPLWTYSTPAPLSVAVADSQSATIQYTVTNQSATPKTLLLKELAGVSASACYLATKGSTCTLTLTVNGSLIPKEGIRGGPVLCTEGNMNQCYQPEVANQLSIMHSLVPGEGHLELNLNGAPINSLAFAPGDSGTLILKNTGFGEVSSISMDLPFGWESYFTNNCPTTLAAQQSCTIVYNIPTPSAVGIWNPLTINASGTNNNITLPVNIQPLGPLMCWGYNNHGQLGDGSTTESSTPVPVNTITNGVSIFGGFYHTCALLNMGEVNCWGNNSFGQLGNGTITSSTTPIQVNTITNAAAITGGLYFSCALLNTREINCWGLNNFGQLGDGTTTTSTTPIPVNTITNAVAITAGGAHTCALLSTGEANCWGLNNNGQLGSSTGNSSTPVPVLTLTNAVAITGGAFHTCALLRTGQVSCWGNNLYGQLGDGSNFQRPLPVFVNNITNAVSITAGTYHTCALLRTGEINCWGSNSFGQLGDGTTTNSNTPIPVNTITNAVSVTAGNDFTCALVSTGEVKCWGSNFYGQLGNDTTTDSSIPVSTCAEPGCLSNLNALGLFNHNLGGSSCTIIAGP